MNGTDVLEELRSLRALAGMSEPHLRELAEACEGRDFPAATVVFREGDPAEHVHFVVSGQVALEICAPATGCRRILTVGPGELLGWSPALEQSRLTATARTLSEVRTVRIAGRRLLELCDRDPRFGYEFMRRAALAIAKRLSATRLQLVDVYGTGMPSAPGLDDGAAQPAGAARDGGAS